MKLSPENDTIQPTPYFECDYSPISALGNSFFYGFGQKLWLRVEINMPNGFLDLKYIDIGEKKYQNNFKIAEIRT